MTTQLTRREYRDSDLGAITNLVGDAAIREALWEWQFQRNPRGLPFRPVVIVDERDRIAGFNGVMPVRVRCDGREFLACWSCDFHVHGDFRGTGVGRIVKDELHGDHPVLMSFGVSPIAARVLTHLGWRASDEVASYRAITRTRDVRDALRRMLQWRNRFRLGLWYARRSGESGLTVERLEALPDAHEVDALWQRVAPTHERIVCRDHAYLSWRYEHCPATSYRFIAVRDGGKLRGLAVHRRHRDATRLVDLILAADDIQSRLELVRAWVSENGDARLLQTTTSDPDLKRVLEAAGFFRSRTRPSFFVRTTHPMPDPERGWFLMPGDSDGEFLVAARDNADRLCNEEPNSAPANAEPSLHVERLDATSAFADASAWDELVARSDADPLFMGWAWQSAWWETWGERLGLEPCILGVFHGERRVGLAPLFLHRRKRLGVSMRQLHFIGNAWRIAPTVRTEYVDVIAEQGYKAAVTNALEVFLRDRVEWDLITVCDHVHQGPFPGLQVDAGVTVVERKQDPGVAIDTGDSFENWLRSLGRNTRLKAFNRRRYLAGRGNLQLASIPDPGAAIDAINEFHRVRWNKPCFEGPSLAFHQRFLERLPRGQQPDFTAIRVDGETLSVLYDMRVGGRMYNIQSGFIEGYDPKVSLGTLHLGFAIEAAFADDTIKRYDLLAGSGKNHFYKRHFKGDEVLFRTFQVVRRPELRFGYGIYRRLPRGLRRPPRRWLRGS